MITIQSVINVFTDFYVLLIPIPRLLRLQVSQRRRVGLLLTFLSGLALVTKFSHVGIHSLLTNMFHS